MNAPSTRERRRPSDRIRHLSVEPLEDRRLLDAGSLVESAAPAPEDVPWQNPTYALDVNHDASTTSSDLLAIINRILDSGVGALPAPDPNPPEFYYDTNGDNRISAVDMLNVINGLLSPPVVSLASMPPYTADRSPRVTVTATGSVDVPDGTIVDLDVDLNNDGDFADPNELGYTQSTIASGATSFELTPALAQSAEPYSVALRARLKNANAVPGSSPRVSLLVDTSSSSALADYVAQPDASYAYQLADAPGITNPIPGATPAGSYFYYVLEMTSQTWRPDDVDTPQWKHWIELCVPVEVSGEVIDDLDDTALLVISGTGSPASVPQSPNPVYARGATGLKTIVANLTIVPNNPLTFSDELAPRTGDEMVAYTFDRFMTELGQPDNETWPLLLPMVKTAVRAMDTIADFIPTLKPDAQINDFAVTGFSNQAWATWLVAAVDDRVSAIIPGVFENLNLPAQLVHQYGAYGFFSDALDDYDALNVYQRILAPEGAELSRIVDPYQYFASGRFDDMPKLLINTPGDEFFTTDSAQFYFDDIPGSQNYLRYIPNTSHALERVEEEVAESTLGFLDAVLNDRPLPEFSWTVDADQTIHVQTVTEPSLVRVRQMNNVNTRDFRRTRYPRIFWFDTVLSDQGGGTYVSNVQMPATGARAYFIELTFPNPVPGLPDFVFTTEVRVKTSLPLFPWPFGTESPDEFDDVQSNLVEASSSFTSAMAPPVKPAGVRVPSHSPLMMPELPEQDADVDEPAVTDVAAKAVDLALAELLGP